MKNVLRISGVILLAFSIFLTPSCKKEKPVPPAVTTVAVSTISYATASSGGEVTNEGSDPVTARGICWNTSADPTVSNSKTSDNSGSGAFTSNMTQLSPNTLYYVRAYATNIAGTGYGNQVTFTTSQIAVATLTTTAITSITQTTAVSGGNITNENGGSVTARGICWGPATNPTTANSKTTDGAGTGSFVSNLTGLQPVTVYYVRSYATNSVGTSYGNEINFTTLAAVPGQPTIGTASAGNAQATVTFSAPVSNGGSAITGYTVASSPGNITGTGSASPITVTGLTNGTAYTFTVTATNAIGNSLASAASNSVTPIAPSTVPGAPTIGTASAGNAQATVTFTVPVSNGGSAITGYTVTSSPGNITGTGTASPITVTGLTNGTAYTFTVTATNAIGTSLASSASNSVTPIAPSTVPGAPTIGSASAGNAQTTVTFTAPVSNGGSAITGYTVTSSPGNITGTGTVSPITVTGLTNGTAYTFTVTATNAIGTSLASSASNSVTPSTVPGAPTIGTASAGNAQATVTFSAPLSNGGSAITGYTVTSSPGNISFTGSASPITLTGLTNGTAYTFTVTATNATGNSLASAASNSVTPSTVPGAPTIGTAFAENAQATVIFTAPVSNGGSAITGYAVTSSPGNITSTGTASPITVTGLTNGTAYTFTVTATNANGTSLASSASNSVTPSTVPGAPTIGIATAGNAQATVTFTAPVSNGGSDITGFTVTSSPGNITGTGTASPITVTGLTNGTAYTFTVTAINAIGNSLASTASNSVTPLTPITDIDGNIYNIVSIGTQLWMAENLKTTKYNDGTAIPNVTVDATWAAATTGAYSDYDNTPANSTTYGRLYNWYSVDNNVATQLASNDGKNVCPTGWHVPSDAEWTILTNYLTNNGYGYQGSGSDIGKSMAATSGWVTQGGAGNVGNDPESNNSSGFTALPGSFRYGNGTYFGIGIGLEGFWWSSNENGNYAWYMRLSGSFAYVTRSYDDKRLGCSVRCLKD